MFISFKNYKIKSGHGLNDVTNKHANSVCGTLYIGGYIKNNKI
jgi:hypothetical protein